jgi:hypothetical protein
VARESADDKARRYIAEGRLEVVRLDPDRGLIHARCRGTDELYDLGFDPGDMVWRCTCEASVKFHRRCSHLRALQLVTTRPRPIRSAE